MSSLAMTGLRLVLVFVGTLVFAGAQREIA